MQCLEHITFQTNLNATQQSQRKVRERFKPFFRNEIEEVIEINLLMGTTQLAYTLRKSKQSPSDIQG